MVGHSPGPHRRGGAVTGVTTLWQGRLPVKAYNQDYKKFDDPLRLDPFAYMLQGSATNPTNDTTNIRPGQGPSSCISPRG
jgi:hypothetical protein